MKKIRAQEVIAVLTLSYAVTKFIEVTNENYGGQLYRTSQSWKSILSFSSISPWTFMNAYYLLRDLALFRGPSEIISKEKKLILRNEQLFIVHDIIHNFTAFMFHTVPMPIFAWLAMMNFPLWFALIDRSMRRKHQLILKRKKDINTSSLLLQQDPLLMISMLIYAYGAISQGQEYLLSATGLIHLSIPFCQRIIETSIIRSAIPISILFCMEHGSIVLGNETCHNLVHTLAHFAIAKFVNNVYIQYFQVDGARLKRS